MLIAYSKCYILEHPQQAREKIASAYTKRFPVIEGHVVILWTSMYGNDS
jgi:hypothetical protein